MSDIFQAAEEGDLARVEELLAQGGLDLAALHGNVLERDTALYKAARGGHIDVSKALIRAGAPLNAPDEYWSPLHAAVSRSHYDLVALLLRGGAEVNERSKCCMTPLHCAKDGRIAALLIAAGADVNGPDYPLHRAARNGYLGVLEEFLSHPEINVNKQLGKLQHTPLHEAAEYRHPECVAALLAAGAAACIIDVKGRTPLLLCSVDHIWNILGGAKEVYSKFPIIAMLVAAGDRQWDHLPSCCPELESALLSVWKEAPQELGQLAARLEPEVKRRIQAALCTLHHASPRHLPDHIRMRLLTEAFNG